MANNGSDFIAGEIRSLLTTRRALLPGVQAKIAAWRDTDQTLVELAAALDLLREHPSIAAETAVGLGFPHLADLRSQIALTIEQLTAVEARYSRDTVNVGVSGSARMGKSTLLQSVSGLDDRHIPTGKDLPVTAVRSRIYHSPSIRRAVLKLHSRESFLKEIIQPYHSELGFAASPRTIDDFRNHAYPDELPEPSTDQVSLLRRLRDIHGALWSYEKDLTGAEMVVDLDDLRPFVAYPTHREVSGDAPVSRRYLAVRDVRIDCAFPHPGVEHLGIVDLPGLGEVAAEAEQHHVRGLQHEVDVILLVKKAVDASAFWTAADARTLKLLDRARGPIRNRGDFVFLVVNTPLGAEALAEPMRAHMVEHVNNGQPGKYFTMLDTDASDAESVRSGVLRPLLHALATRLPVMDAEYLAGAEEAAVSTGASLASALADLQEAVRGIRSTGGDEIESVLINAEELREDLAGGLEALVERLRLRALSEEDDPEYISAIKGVYQDVSDWIDDGFGSGKDAWITKAVRRFTAERGTGAFADDAVNWIRVEIARRFAALDSFYSGQIEEARREVGVILRENTGTLLDREGSELLRDLADLLDNPRRPCPALRAAVTGLLELRMEYRSHLHPRLRPHLDVLQMSQRSPEIRRDEEGAHELFRFCQEMAQNAAHEIRKALLDGEVTPVQVTYAAVEQFVDIFIRSGPIGDSKGSRREFERFARAYRNEIWPGTYQGIAEGNVRHDRVQTLIESLQRKIDGAGRAA
ncbi:hypothetical protein [Herbidospora mongoliensis]|uniref:hypothetical protein n=1 Tax=Herbidospora mongoliensis TaxID=688067 RepID=UPI0008318F50|nr:hypothetical protein [Herbidospora mongoliensis]